MTSVNRPGAVVSIRPLHEADVPHLAKLFRDSIRLTGASHYSSDQVAAWSALGDDVESFREWLHGASVWVAGRGGAHCLGFASLQAPNRIASLFVAPHSMRLGVGTALVRHLLSELDRQGESGATTEASELSRPVFERCGFDVVALEYTQVRGVDFTRYVMRLDGLE